jgi:hypothetical protein
MLDSLPEYRKVNRVIVAEVPTVSSVFPRGEALEAVLKIVQEYPKKAANTGPGKRGLGFGDTGALFLPLGSSAPNNMPDLLIRNGKRYRAIFPSRVIPPDIKGLMPGPTPTPVRNAGRYNEDLRRAKLAAAAKVSNEGRSKDWAMLLLMALGYDAARIRNELGLSFLDSKSILKRFESIGWATKAFTLTELGNTNLRDFGRSQNYSDYKRGLHLAFSGFDDEKSPYYPKSVRGVR